MELCPLCNTNDIKHFRNYFDRFLSCKTLKKCNECKLIFASLLPSNEELNLYYSTSLYYDKYEHPFNQEFQEFSYKLAKTRIELVYNKIKNNIFNNVLDIGAGNAQFGKALLDKSANLNYDVVEPSETINIEWGTWVRNQFNNIDEVDYDKYNLIVMNQVLEHVNDPIEFLQSASRFLENNGYLYIDVPYKDYLFKPSLEPHILFWNKKSLSLLLQKVGFELIYCDTAGMPHKQAKRFFSQQAFIQKVRNPWLYKGKINIFLRKMGLPKLFDTFRQFQANCYGGNRQWLRCIAQKMELV